MLLTTLILWLAYLGVGCGVLLSISGREWRSGLATLFCSYELYALILISAIVWPLLLAPKARESASTRLRAWWIKRSLKQKLRAGVTFSNMGGAGTIRCFECGFQERITSFMHGFADNGERNCYEGRQCLSCGKFHVVYGQGEPIRRDEKSCECGGTLSRDHKLFCTPCRSQRLQFVPGIIA